MVVAGERFAPDNSTITRDLSSRRTQTAFFSVGIIVLRGEPHLAWTVLIGIGWTVGIIMQIVAGAIARTRV
jgi:hypothetical protein